MLRLGRQDQVHATGQCHRTFASAQALAGQMNGNQRRRTGGVHRQARSVQAEEIRHPPRSHTVGIAQCRIGVNRQLIAEDHATVVAVAVANEHTRRGAGQARWVNDRVFERFPGNFLQQPLLRIHAGGLARRYAEKTGVELIHVSQEGAVPCVHLTRDIRVGIVVGVHIPALAGNLRHGVHSVGEQLPE